MKTLLIITGTSTGIGKAISEKFLSEKVVIHGLGRRCKVKHHNYTHHETDLRDLSTVLSFEFPDGKGFERIILINNAGIIGDIKPTGKVDDLCYAETFQVNLTAPAMLTNRFLAAYSELPAEKVIVNVSSGAGKFPVPSWSAYCASKAGIDMFSEVVALENRTKSVRVYSVAPGIVETPMQETIRSVPAGDFERVSDFIGYYKNNELVPPALVADQMWKLVNDTEQREVLISFRDYR